MQTGEMAGLVNVWQLLSYPLEGPASIMHLAQILQATILHASIVDEVEGQGMGEREREGGPLG